MMPRNMQGLSSPVIRSARQVVLRAGAIAALAGITGALAASARRRSPKAVT
jgi:hypothetical protein